MREPPSIIKATNALKAASAGDPITQIPYISAKMADRLVEKCYATRTPWSKNRAIGCYRLDHTCALDALEETTVKPKLEGLESRLVTLPPLLKTLDRSSATMVALHGG